MKAIIFAFVLLSLPGLGLAQATPNSYSKVPSSAPDPRVVELQTALNQVNQAQQSLYLKFQMARELRLNAMQETFPLAMGQLPYSGLNLNPIPSYDETVRLQRQRQERIEQYTRDVDELYSRYSELEEQKRVLLDQLMEVTKGQAQ